MQLFSNNIVFLDTEFSTLDPYKGEILSVGIVKLNGEELYLELEYDGNVSEWVEKNIIPTLNSSKVDRNEAKKLIKDFIGDKRPYAVGFINQFDAIYTYKLFGVDKHPFYWIPIDFASILFSYGINPEDYILENKTDFFGKLGIDLEKFKQHNALDDAKLLREAFLKFFEL